MAARDHDHDHDHGGDEDHAGHAHTGPAHAGHSHAHHHHGRQGASLLISIGLNLGFALIELVVGVIANSLALMADALHDLGDAVALGLSYFGWRLARRGPSPERTFGYRKVQILTAFVNAVVLGMLTMIVLRAAVLRLLAPEPVRSPLLMLTAAGGIVVNGLAILVLRRDRGSLNIRAATWHMAEDFLGWIAVFVGGGLIYLTNWYWVDPLLSILVSLLVLYGAYSIFREAAGILLDSTPRGLSVARVREFILAFDPRVAGIHDLHVWSLGEGERALMAHLVVPDDPISSFLPMLTRLECDLGREFAIDHVTLELECAGCKSGDRTCGI